MPYTLYKQCKMAAKSTTEVTSRSLKNIVIAFLSSYMQQVHWGWSLSWVSRFMWFLHVTSLTRMKCSGYSVLLVVSLIGSFFTAASFCSIYSSIEVNEVIPIICPSFLHCKVHTHVTELELIFEWHDARPGVYYSAQIIQWCACGLREPSWSNRGHMVQVCHVPQCQHVATCGICWGS